MEAKVEISSRRGPRTQNDHCVSVSMFILIVPASIAYWMSSVLEPEPPWNTK